MEAVEKELALIHGEKDADLGEIREAVHNSVMSVEEIYGKRSAAESEKQNHLKDMEEEQKF